MIKVQVRGVKFFYDDDGRNPYRTLALAEVFFPDLSMTIRDVRLAWCEKRGFVSHSPSTRRGAPSIEWYHQGPLAKAMTAAIAEMYRKMGGEDPGMAVRRDHVTGKPIGPDPFDAKEAIARAKAGGIERRVFPATFTVHEDDPANDNDMTGVLRTLGIESEEAQRACG